MMIPLKIYKAILLLFLVGGTATTLCAQTGCIDPWACNYAEFATSDDGSCEYESCRGCTLSWACNYIADATLDDGSCVFECVMGCTYQNADGCGTSIGNYDPLALFDDGSCLFGTSNPCPTDLNCDGITDTMDLLDIIAAYGTGCTGGTFVQEQLPPFSFTSNLRLGLLVSGGGCTHPEACNYNPDAPVDDGSCEFYSCAGCTYAIACNYDPAAWINDSTCEFTSCEGCTYEASANYQPTAVVDDGSCTFNGVVPCYSDINGDGYTGADDLLLVLAQMGNECIN